MRDKFLNLLKDTKIDLTKACFVPSSGTGFLIHEFDITPKDFLRFAKQDLKQNDERGFINSLTNSKRAIDCQVDEVLEKIGIKHNDFNLEIKDFLKPFDLDKDIPIKLGIINVLNLAPSLLIAKTRTFRNKLEHIYQKPTAREVKEALDVADLFIRSVEGKFTSLLTEFGLTDEKNYEDDTHWDFKNGLFFMFDIDKLCFEINKIIDTRIVEQINLTSKDRGYYDILRLMFSIDDNIEIEVSLKALLKHIGHPIPSKKVSIIQT